MFVVFVSRTLSPMAKLLSLSNSKSANARTEAFRQRGCANLGPLCPRKLGSSLGSLILQQRHWASCLSFLPSRTLSSILALLLSAILGLPEFVFGAESSTEKIKPGLPFHRQLSGDEQHTYLLALTEGQHGKLLIDSGKADLDFLLFSPAEKLIRQSRLGLAESGETRQIVSIVATVTGTYRVELKAPSKLSVPLSYTLQIDELRSATD